MSREAEPHSLQRPLGLTVGEPGGVGLELFLHCCANECLHAPIVALGPLALIEDAIRSLKLGLTCQPVTNADLQSLSKVSGTVFVAECGQPMAYQPGELSEKGALTAIAAIETGVDLAMSGLISGLVTNPINKDALLSVGFSFPGHTEFLGHLCGLDLEIVPPVMMLASEDLRVVPTTIHIPLDAVPMKLTPGLLAHTIKTVDAALRTDFRVADPHIAVAGLNPHAGENGRMGLEERDLIAPTVKQLQQGGINLSGPLPADTLFHADARKAYDACVCMYHDQALIPIKTIAFDDAANITLGLPIVRTSPDHGTALDIAGKGIARPQSLLTAIHAAGEIAANRERSRIV